MSDGAPAGAGRGGAGGGNLPGIPPLTKEHLAKLHSTVFYLLGGEILVSHRARLNAQGAQPGSTVETMLGRVRGLASPGVIAFKGLRYGASTTAANRFQPPVKPAAWTGVRDAFEYGPRAWPAAMAFVRRL